MKSCRFANFTMDARVSPVFLPNKCACLDSKKHVSTIGFFLTNWKLSNNRCQIFIQLWELKRSQKSAKRQVFQKYSFCLIQIILFSELSYHLFLKSAVHSSMNCLWVQKLVITILCATLAYKKQVVWIHSNGNKNLHGKIYWFGQEHWFLNT